MNPSLKRRRTEHLTVSLFPFLAVLICTMGILIVLLVISVQSADLEAQDRKESNTKVQMAKLTDLKEREELLAFEADNVESVRVDVSQRLLVAKSDRSYLEQQLRETENQARELFLKYQQVQKLATAAPAKQSLASDDELETLKQQIREAEVTLEKKRAELPKSKAQTNYQIVPYAGSGGTNRQPIFIECDIEGLVLQPYGIRLAKNDFINPNVIGNLLDSALLAIREYHLEHQLTDEETRPYPLLVVRPDGAQSYGLARRAMKSWDDEFGYELVDGDVPLSFGSGDPALKALIVDTIEKAKIRQTRMALKSRLGDQITFGSRYKSSRGHSQGGAFAREYNDGGDGHSQVERTSKLQGKPPSQGTRQKNGQKPTGSIANQAQSSASTRANQMPRRSAGGTAGGKYSLGNSTESLSQTRGKNWALPTQTSGANAYVRPIRLACEAGQFVILSQDRIVSTIKINGQTRSAIDPLVSEIWKTIDRWGVAGNSAFWKPELRFSVMPGGEQRFADLQRLLDDSGLIVETAQ